MVALKCNVFKLKTNYLFYQRNNCKRKFTFPRINSISSTVFSYDWPNYCEKDEINLKNIFYTKRWLNTLSFYKVLEMILWFSVSTICNTPRCHLFGVGSELNPQKRTCVPRYLSILFLSKVKSQYTFVTCKPILK